MSFPRAVAPWADSHTFDSNVWALYSTEPVRNPEHAFNDYRSVVDPTATHRAGVRWAAPVQVAQVRLSWIPGHAPRALRVGVERAGGVRWLSAEAPFTEWAVEEAVLGVVVEQPPAGGPAANPGQLRIAGLEVVFAARPALRVGYRQGGRAIWPALPLAVDGDPATHLDISDAEALLLDRDDETPVAGLRLTVLRLGARPRWVAGLPGAVFVDRADEGVVAGVHHVTVAFDAAFTGRSLTLPITCERPFVGAIRALEWLPLGARGVGDRVTPPAVEAIPRARTGSPAAWTIDAVRAGWAAPRHAASFGLPGTDLRCAMLPDGVVLVPRGRRRQALWVRVTADDAAITRSRGADEGRLTAVGGGLRQRWTPERLGVRCVVTAERPLVLRLAASLRDGLFPASQSEALAVDRPGVDTLDEWSTEVPLGPGEVLSFSIPAENAGRPIATPAWVERRLPPALAEPVAHLLREALNFVQADDRVPYGVFPSVYDRRVFGLEEDYLFRALAQWGAGDLALRCFRATYLTDVHLDPGEYLHDLRYGLTPWQAWWLTRLTGAALTDGERARLAALGEWTLRERAKTADATGALVDGRRVFPGLLPPYRYGGDLDFPTQSLSANAAHVCGLRALAELTGDPGWRDAADAHRAALLHAFAEMAAHGPVQLQTGGGDPGDYVQLTADGILLPLDCLAADDPLARRLDREIDEAARRFFELPRFDGWGGGHAIDAHYGLGHLRNLLHRGARERFWTGLLALLGHAMDPDVHTFREVSPVRRAAVDEAFVPGRRLSQAEPCVGGVGVALQLVRDAFVSELRGPDGWPDGRLRILGGALPDWWATEVAWGPAPTLYGPVAVRAFERRVEVIAPPSARLEIVGPAGQVVARDGGAQTVSFA